MWVFFKWICSNLSLFVFRKHWKEAENSGGFWIFTVPLQRQTSSWLLNCKLKSCAQMIELCSIIRQSTVWQVKRKKFDGAPLCIPAARNCWRPSWATLKQPRSSLTQDVSSQHSQAGTMLRFWNTPDGMWRNQIHQVKSTTDFPKSSHIFDLIDTYLVLMYRMFFFLLTFKLKTFKLRVDKTSNVSALDLFSYTIN